MHTFGELLELNKRDLVKLVKKYQYLSNKRKKNLIKIKEIIDQGDYIV